MRSKKHLGWCSSCYQLNVVTGDSDQEVFLDDYLTCQTCSGVGLRLPSRFADYAVPAWSFLMSQKHTGPESLAELGRALGQARAQQAGQGHGRTKRGPIATVTAIAPCLEHLLTCAHERNDLNEALLALWILVGELLATTDDSSVGGISNEREGKARVARLHRVISEVAVNR